MLEAVAAHFGVRFQSYNLSGPEGAEALSVREENR